MKIISLQFQIDMLAVGLRNELMGQDEGKANLYYGFATYFVDDNENLQYFITQINKNNE